MAGTTLECAALLAAGSAAAGVHAGLAPGHLREWMPLGIAFVAAAAVVAAAVVAYAVEPEGSRPALALGLVLGGLVVAYAATRLAALPPLDPAREPPDALGLATCAVEVAGTLVALRRLTASARGRTLLRGGGIS